MKRLSTKGNHELNQIIEHLANYGVIGLRTLLLAERVLDETYF